LDDRIAKTLAKKTALLRVLDLPQLPLHNNDSELGARVQARSALKFKVDTITSFSVRNGFGAPLRAVFLGRVVLR
jgi:hypothetical protein